MLAFSTTKSELVHTLEIIDSYIMESPSTSSKIIRLNFSKNGATIQLGYVYGSILTVFYDEYQLKTSDLKIGKHFSANFSLPALLESLRGLTNCELRVQMLSPQSPITIASAATASDNGEILGRIEQQIGAGLRFSHW